MMSLVLGDFTYAIYECQSLFEVGKAKRAVKMMLVYDVPLGYIVLQSGQLS